MTAEKTILNLKEAAAYCGYSEDGFWKICQSPSGPRYSQRKKWGRLRFRVEWLDEWLDGGQVVKAEPPKPTKKKTRSLSPPSNSGIDLGLLKIGNRNNN